MVENDGEEREGREGKGSKETMSARSGMMQRVRRLAVNIDKVYTISGLINSCISFNILF